MFCQISIGQYAVFHVEGSPDYVEKVQPIKKGDYITHETISIAQKDTLIIIDDKGFLYQLDKSKSYVYKQLKNFKKQDIKEGLSEKYFSYVWKQMKNKNQTKHHTGNIYREGLIDFLQYPSDSLSIYKDYITFEWRDHPDKEYAYFFLKNMQTEELVKFKVEGNSITLYADHVLLKKGGDYLWGVAYDKFPDFNQVKFRYFKYLDSLQFGKYKEEYELLITELKSIGLSKEELRSFLSIYYNFSF